MKKEKAHKRRLFQQKKTKQTRLMHCVILNQTFDEETNTAMKDIIVLVDELGT